MGVASALARSKNYHTYKQEALAFVYVFSILVCIIKADNKSQRSVFMHSNILNAGPWLLVYTTTNYLDCLVRVFYTAVFFCSSSQMWYK